MLPRILLGGIKVADSNLLRAALSNKDKTSAILSSHEFIWPALFGQTYLARSI